jgi:hypothetical protein
MTPTLLLLLLAQPEAPDDGTAVVLVRRGFEPHLLVGWGGRTGEGGASLCLGVGYAR